MNPYSVMQQQDRLITMGTKKIRSQKAKESGRKNESAKKSVKRKPRSRKNKRIEI